MKWFLNNIQAILFSFLSLGFCANSNAQESFISPLSYNPSFIGSTTFKTSALDTLSLPFFEDFAGNTDFYPNPKRWIDRSAYVNNSFPLNTISIGVATMDGLDDNGDPYNLSSADSYGEADELTSQCINLAQLLPSDSVYLSFFYQRGGIGDNPELKDSLVLQYKVNDSTWATQWLQVGGTGDTTFKQVLVPIKDSLFFKDDFQFRFKNYGTLSGAFDLWHLDYIRLDSGRNNKDTALFDLCITGEPTKFLNRAFRVVPYSEFSVNDVDTTYLAIRNNYVSEIINFKYIRKIIYNSDTISSPQAAEQYNGGEKGIVRFDPIGLGSITPTAPFGLELLYFIDSNDVVSINDTLRRKQLYSNYYAYDDGTPEFAYGIKDAPGARLAIRFETKGQEVLEEVRMLFVQSQEDVSTRTFDLAVWLDLDAPPVYRKEFINPKYSDVYNQFTSYIIDSPITVNGVFYVGWIQNSSKILNLGFDVSRNNKNQVFVNFANEWEPESINGTPMIRAVIKGDGPIAGVNTKNISQGNVYPNPVSDIIHLNGIKEGQSSDIQIFNLQGQLVFEEENTNLDHGINISNLPDGMYIISGNFGTSRFVKNSSF